MGESSELSFLLRAEENCQFFICLGEASFLDGQYSAFGRIADDASLAVLQEIGKIPVKDSDSGEKSSPVEPVTIERMSVAEVNG